MAFWLVAVLGVLAWMTFNYKWFVAEWRAARRDWKKWLKRMWKEWGEPFLIAAVLALALRAFIVGPYKIPTGSMRPTLMEGDRIFVDKVTYRFRPPARGEIIVFKFPDDPKKDFIKRLIAFEGEEVEIKSGVVYINGRPLDQLTNMPHYYYYNQNDSIYGKEHAKVRVPPDSFYVLGDNSAHSHDSRYWGFIPKHYLIGKAFLIWWPLTRFGFLH